MKFEVNKFLALTALLAGASAVAAGCSSTDSKQAPGGSSGDAGDTSEPRAGAGNTTGDGGAAGASDAQGGAAGAHTDGGASDGGASDGGASDGGAAGATVGSCIADIVGAAGAADESTPCDLLGAAGAPDCGDEGGNSVAQECDQLYRSALYRPSVVLAFNACATALANSCDLDGVHSCALGLIGQGCTQAGTAAACTFIESKCPGTTLCTGLLDLATPEGQVAIADCMDPASESYIEYEPGNCNVNLQYCASLPVPPLR